MAQASSPSVFIFLMTSLKL